MRKARRKGVSLRGDISLATVPLRGLLGAFTMRPPRRSSIWLVLTLRPRNVCNKRTRGQARPNGHQRKRNSACVVYSYGVPRHSWMNKRALQRRLYEENCPSLRTRVRWRFSGLLLQSYRAATEFSAAVHCRGQAGASGSLSEMGICVLGIRNELQPKSRWNSDVHKCFRHASGVRLFRRQRKVAGQDHVRAGSVWVDFARLDQQAWQLSNGIVWPGRGSKRRITICGQMGLLQFFGGRQDGKRGHTKQKRVLERS